jgi:iron(III) transport system substrate-binding protein
MRRRYGRRCAARVRAAPLVVWGALAAAVTLLGACGPAAGGGDGAGVVNVYSHRHYDADRVLFQRFTEETGIRVNVVTGSADELITRLENEGANSPADVLITVDAGRLERALERGLLQPVRSAALEAAVPAAFRGRDGGWYGLTRRARVIVYNRERVRPEELSTYEALAEPRWRGRLLMRTSENVYSQSLLASLLAVRGEDAAARWVEGVVANLARTPSGSDTDQIRAVAAGAADLTVVNTYYVARLLASADAEDRRLAARVGVYFPNQADRGTHINVSGAGVTASSRNPGNAVRLLEFLAGREAQALFAEGNQEYPVNPQIPATELLQAFGDFRADTQDLARLGALNTAAVRIADRGGWK